MDSYIFAVNGIILITRIWFYCILSINTKVSFEYNSFVIKKEKKKVTFQFDCLCLKVHTVKH